VSDAILEPVRLAVALAHCLPDCRVELTGADGARVCVGFGIDANVTPCTACRAVAAAMRTTPRELGPMLGLAPGCPRARVLDEAIADSHVGLGVYRYRGEHAWGFVFATLSGLAIVRRAIESASGELLLGGTDTEWRVVEVGRWEMLHDDSLRVTICFSAYPLDETDWLDEAEALALAIAARCLVEELVTG
jgi:hypothetical protein